ncbi:MAG: glycosyltransferase family 39 protein [Candidatus Promineifilaceae bacterium]
MKKRYHHWIPVGLLLLAFALAVYRVDAQDIWGDEALSITVSQSPLGASLFMETNPPFYFLLLRVGRGLWGSSVFGLRYLSVICSLLTVAIIGRIAHTIAPRSRNYALLAAAVSPLLIYYAQEARMYGPVLVGAAGSVLAFLQLLRGRRTFGWWTLYVFSTLAAIFSHYYAFSILFAEALLVALWVSAYREWRFFGRMLTIWLGMAAAFIPYFIQHQRIWSNQTDFRITEWSIGELFLIGRRTLIAFGAGVTISAEQQYLGWLVVLIALIGAGWVARQNKWGVGMLVATVALGILTAWGLTPLLPFFWERYLLGVLPAFLVLVGFGLASIASWHSLAKYPLFAGFLLLSAIPTWQYQTQPQYIKGGYGQTMRFIEARAQDGDLILLNGPLQGPIFDYYRPTSLEGVMIDRAALFDPAQTDLFFNEAVGGAQRIWLVASGNPIEFDPDGKANGWLAKNGSFALHRDYPGVGLDLFVMQAPTDPQKLLAVNLSDDVQLTGYALGSNQLVAGEAVILSLFWQAQQPLDKAYTVFTHVLDANGQLVAQADRQPQGGSRPTNSWSTNETIRDSYALELPDDLPAGDYHIHIGMYLWPELTRLVDQETGQDSVLIDTVTITP